MKKFNKDTKTKKKKKTNRKRIEESLDKAWSDYVHKRDVFCRICGGRNSLQAHHAFGRIHRGTRWDVMNGVLLCWPHHKHFAHGDPCGFANWFSKQVGEGNYSRLNELHNRTCHFTEDELIEKLNWFKKEANNEPIQGESCY